MWSVCEPPGLLSGDAHPPWRGKPNSSLVVVVVVLLPLADAQSAAMSQGSEEVNNVVVVSKGDDDDRGRRHRNSDACSYKSLVEVIVAKNNGDTNNSRTTRSSAGSLKPEHQLRKMLQNPRARSMMEEASAGRSSSTSTPSSRRLVRQKATEQYNATTSTNTMMSERMVSDTETNCEPMLSSSSSSKMSRQWTLEMATPPSTTTAAHVARRARSPLLVSLARPETSSLLMSSSSSSLTPRLGEMRAPNTRISMTSFNRSCEVPGVSSSRHRVRRSPNQPLVGRGRGVGGSHHHLGERQRSNGTLSKQRTSESAPSQGGQHSHVSLGVHDVVHGSANVSFVRQTSNASAFSVVYSQPGMTLVRGASCSLVDIPTYLGPTLASNGVEVLAHSVCETANLANVGGSNSPVLPIIDSSNIVIRGSGCRNPRRRLQLDLRRKTDPKTSRKTQWTVLCVSLTLLTLAVTLVGTMLSVGGEYQEQLIARKFNETNGSSRRLRNFDKEVLENTVGKQREESVIHDDLHNPHSHGTTGLGESPLQRLDDDHHLDDDYHDNDQVADDDLSSLSSAWIAQPTLG